MSVSDDYWKKFSNVMDVKLSELELKLTGAITKHEKQVELMKTRCDIYEEKIETLKSIICKQQRAINEIDAGDRDKNIIISRMIECNLVDGDAVYENDEQKVSALFKAIGIALPLGAKVERLGKPNQMYKRVIKLNVTSKQNRDEILKKTNILKTKGSPWDTVFVKKDLHPVIVQENNRLRIKKKNLQKLDENKDKVVKIEKGKLTIDGTMVDQNMFFV